MLILNQSVPDISKVKIVETFPIIQTIFNDKVCLSYCIIKHILSLLFIIIQYILLNRLKAILPQIFTSQPSSTISHTLTHPLALAVVRPLFHQPLVKEVSVDIYLKYPRQPVKTLQRSMYQCLLQMYLDVVHSLIL